MSSLVAQAAVLFLLTSLALAWRGMVLGRRVAEEIKRREPKFWRDLGEPEPRWFLSLRGQRWGRFLSSREYESLPHEDLKHECEQLRTYEVRLMSFVLVGFVLLAGAIVTLKKSGGG